MDLTTRIVYFLADLVLPLAAGYLFRFSSRPGERFYDRVLIFNIFWLFPPLALLSVWGLPLNRELVWLPFFGVLMHAVSGAAGMWMARKKYASPLDRGSYVMCAILSNVMTLGGLSVFILFGEAAYAHMQLTILFGGAIVYGFAFPLAARFQHEAENPGEAGRPSFSKAFTVRNQMALAGILGGLALNVGGVGRPAPLTDGFHWLVHLSAWTALMPVGRFIDFREMRVYWAGVADLAVLKFLLTPAAIYTAGRLLISDPAVLNTLVVLAFGPAAINAVIAARVFRLNTHIATAAFVLTTAVYIFLIFPLFFLIF